MSEEPLQVRLEATNQLTGQYTLSFDSSHYPITLRPEINVTFSKWLRRLRPLLVGGNDLDLFLYRYNLDLAILLD